MAEAQPSPSGAPAVSHGGMTGDQAKSYAERVREKYPIWCPTVDIALVQQWHDGYHVLLGMKEREKPHMRFPGGFIDAEDRSPEGAAHRELMEETRLTTPHLEPLGSYFITDYRYPGVRIVTTFYLGWSRFEARLGAGDDLGYLSWRHYTELATDAGLLAQSHRILGDVLLARLTARA